MFLALVLSLALFTCLAQAKEKKNDSPAKLKAQSRVENSKKTGKVDMTSVLQQHLIGPNISNPGGNNDKELRGTSGKEEKKGRLQTVGSVLGDIIGVLVSEVARFFGSVVSDVAREVTAHGFVSLLKQVADFTGISLNGASGAPTMANAPHFG